MPADPRRTGSSASGSSPGRSPSDPDGVLMGEPERRTPGRGDCVAGRALRTIATCCLYFLLDALQLVGTRTRPSPSPRRPTLAQPGRGPVDGLEPRGRIRRRDRCGGELQWPTPAVEWSSAARRRERTLRGRGVYWPPISRCGSRMPAATASRRSVVQAGAMSRRSWAARLRRELPDSDPRRPVPPSAPGRSHRPASPAPPGSERARCLQGGSRPRRRSSRRNVGSASDRPAAGRADRADRGCIVSRCAGWCVGRSAARSS